MPISQCKSMKKNKLLLNLRLLGHKLEDQHSPNIRFIWLKGMIKMEKLVLAEDLVNFTQWEQHYVKDGQDVLSLRFRKKITLEKMIKNKSPKEKDI